MVLILGWSCGSRLLSLKLVILPCVRSTSQRTSRCGDEDVNKLQPEIVEDHSSPARLDGNNVDIDSEMMRLSKANGRSCLTVAAFARTRVLSRQPALWRVQLRGTYLLPFA